MERLLRGKGRGEEMKEEEEGAMEAGGRADTGEARQRTAYEALVLERLRPVGPGEARRGARRRRGRSARMAPARPARAAAAARPLRVVASRRPTRPTTRAGAMERGRLARARGTAAQWTPARKHGCVDALAVSSAFLDGYIAHLSCSQARRARGDPAQALAGERRAIAAGRR